MAADTTTTSFWMTSSFWQAVAAVVAIALSQLPPIKTWFKRAKVDIEVYMQGWITHKVGYPNFQLHIILRNIGNKRIRVKQISIDVERDGTHITALPARNYRPLNQEQDILFTPITINADSEWSNLVNFFPLMTREESKNFSDYSTALRKDITDKVAKLTDEEKKAKTYVVAEENHYKPFIDMFDAKFIWKSGEYKIKLKVLSDSPQQIWEEGYRFTVFESDEAKLRIHTNDYSKGFGVILNSAEHEGVFIELSKAK